MKLQLGINNCFAVKRWPRADEWAQIVSDELGLSTLQHSLDLSPDVEHWQDEAEGICTACDRRGLWIDSVFTGVAAYSGSLMLAPSATVRDYGFRFWEAGIGFAAMLGARAFGGHVGSLSRADTDNRMRRDERWDELRRMLARLARTASRARLESLLVENMACDREPSSIADVDSLLSPSAGQHAAIKLCLDVGHQCVPGATGDDADPYVWLRLLGQRTHTVHLQQSDYLGDRHWPFTQELNVQGRIRADRVIESLLESGVQQMTLILEVIPSFEAEDAQVLADLRESVGYWREEVDKFTDRGVRSA